MNLFIQLLSIMIFVIFTGTLRTENKLSDSVPDLEREDSDDHNSSRDEDLWRRPPTSAFDQRLSRKYFIPKVL